jgi:methyl acetate hydrolase
MSPQHSIDHLLSEAAKLGDIPGVAAMVTSSEHTLYEGAFGVRSLTRSEPMTIDTVVGSRASFRRRRTVRKKLQSSAI